MAAVHTQLGPKVPGCWTGRVACPSFVGDAPINPQPIRVPVRVYNKFASLAEKINNRVLPLVLLRTL